MKPRTTGLKRITFVITTTWGTLYGRPHQMASLFKQDGYEISVIDLGFVLARIREKLARTNMYESQLSIADRRYSFTYAVPRRIARRIKFHPRFDKESLSRFLFKLVGKAFTDDSIIWVQGISLLYDPKTFEDLPNSLFISDIEDDYKYFYKQQFQAQIQQIESEMARNADLVFATSQPLYERLITLNSKTHLIPNGVDENFIQVAEGKLHKPADMPDGIVIGFEGAIANWLDFDLLYTLAEAIGNAKIVLVGKLLVSLDRELFKKLTSLSNVVYLGEKPYHELPTYISYFDVGIIPFSISSLTKAVHPNKLYEYLSCGIPVVSTMLPEIARYAREGVLEVADDTDSFISATRKMIACRRDSILVTQRVSIARDNTWRSRYQKIKDLIQNELKIKGI